MSTDHVPRPPDGADDRALEHAYGRPTGVTESFDPDASGRPVPTGAPATPPAPALASAFGRPEGSDGLQRPAGDDRAGTSPAGETFWSDDDEARRDPWRDPDAPVEPGPPARPRDDGDGAQRPRGARLSVREVLFGGWVAPHALAVLGAVALLVGTAGGVVGYLAAGGADRLTDPGAELAAVDPAVARPPGSVADVARRVVPAVVSMEIRSGTSGGTGSGVVLDDRGDIVTNNHVVALAATDPRATLDAVFTSGLRAPARVVGRDPNTDLAVVHVDVANPTVAQLGSSSRLQVGDGVIAVGSPLGLAGTVTEGIVSSVRRPVRLDAESPEANPVIDAVQTDAAVNPGNSGGALIDAGGAVVGINTAIRTLGGGGGGSGGEGGSIGLGFAIPIDTVRDVAQSIIRTGGAAHPDLGLNAKSVSDGTADGAQVLNVRDGAPAARAGLAPGDVVTRVDDRGVRSPDELTVAVREHRPGETITLSVVRGGRPLALPVTL